jgi:hypothetical protein
MNAHENHSCLGWNPTFGLKNLTRKYAKNDILYSLCCTLKFSLLAQILWWPVAIQNRDLLAPRRQERQVWKSNFFAAFAPLREVFRVLVAAPPR